MHLQLLGNDCRNEPRNKNKKEDDDGDQKNERCGFVLLLFPFKRKADASIDKLMPLTYLLTDES